MAGPKITRVVLADDHEKIRLSIRDLLKNTADIEVIGEAKDGLEAIRMVDELHPDVLLLDMEMPFMKGDEVARRLKETGSPVHILALSAYDDRQYILEMLEMGVSGYLIKDEAPEVIVDAVHSIAGGEKGWVSRKAAVRVRREL